MSNQIDTPKDLMSQIDLVSAAFVAAQGELKAAAFDSTNPFMRNKYASLGAVIESSRPVLAKHKLGLLQVATIDGQSVTIDTLIVHASGQSLNGGSMTLDIGEEKGKSRAQVAGSICTYLRRYSWATCLGIYADEDTDGNSPVGHTNRQEAADDQDEPKNAPEAHCEPKPTIPEVTPATRMKLLNLLKAAPGQDNRQLVKDFFVRAKNWLNADQELEDLPLNHVPRTQKEFHAIVEDIEEFSRRVTAPEEEGEKIV